jgi:hypothetical protein
MRGSPLIFSPIAFRGDRVKSEKTFKETYWVDPGQQIADLTIYYTREYDRRSYDREDIKTLKTWMATLDDPPDERLQRRSIEVALTFEPTPKATVKNTDTNHVYEILNLETPAGDGF